MSERGSCFCCCGALLRLRLHCYDAGGCLQDKDACSAVSRLPWVDGAIALRGCAWAAVREEVRGAARTRPRILACALKRPRGPLPGASRSVDRACIERAVAQTARIHTHAKVFGRRVGVIASFLPSVVENYSIDRSSIGANKLVQHWTTLS